MIRTGDFVENSLGCAVYILVGVEFHKLGDWEPDLGGLPNPDPRRTRLRSAVRVDKT